MNFPEQFRNCQTGTLYENNPGDKFGYFVVPASKANGRALKIIAVDGQDTGWEHVSVSLWQDKRCPSWAEMCMVKDLFWNESELVVQFHPAKADYINRHPGCLHMWRSVKDEFPMPPKICV